MELRQNLTDLVYGRYPGLLSPLQYPLAPFRLIEPDDLDYFVNDHPDFNRLADRQIAKLNAAFKDVHVALRGDNFVRLFVAPARMKIEMINDVPSHIGALVEHPVFGIIDLKAR